jgi:predicted SAM-dependent methyltransferase
MAQAYPAVAYPTTSNTPDPLRKLRVGFVSGDLRRHSVSYFVEGLLRHLDRNLIETWVFYTYPGEDYRSAELKPFAHKWIPVHGTTDAHFAQHIRQSGIDILFDLSGHTGHGRLAVFALKAAPIQISWIGYPNTSGLKTMDYRISDAIADPPGIADNYCSETLLRLPGCFLCYTPPAEAPEVKEPPHLASQRIAFGSFNAVSKIGDATLSLWSRVLAAIPDSILVLKAADAFNTEERRERLLTRLSEVGVAPERVRLLPWERDVGKHLATYGEIDIALDTVPYNGTTTTCEALWMGVPVVSLTGDRHAARVGTSLLCAAGLEELVAANADQFVKICTELASDSDRLTRLRSGMRKRLLASPLCDEPGMATRLERALREVWQDWCARQGTGLAAEGGDLAADTTSTQYHDTETTLRIHLGGKEHKSGWKILNVQPGPNVDLVGDVRDLSAFADDSVAEVYASHVLEHVGQAEFLQTLKGIHRILAPGARLYISVPDMDILCRDFVDPKFDRAQRYHLMRILFGGQSDPFDFHQIGLNLDFMADFLQQAGFYSVEQVESFGLFDDASNVAPFGTPISLNLIAVK